MGSVAAADYCFVVAGQHCCCYSDLHLLEETVVVVGEKDLRVVEVAHQHSECSDY